MPAAPRPRPRAPSTPRPPVAERRPVTPPTTAAPRRRLRVAARQGGPRGDGVPHRGERHTQARPPTWPTCARRSSTRSGPGPADRPVGADPQARLLVLRPDLRGPGVRRQLPVPVTDADDWTPRARPRTRARPARAARRAGAARPRRARGGPRFFSLGGSAITSTAGCSPGAPTPPATSATRSGSRTSRPASRSTTSSAASSAGPPGPPTGVVLLLDHRRDLAARQDLAAPARHRPGRRQLVHHEADGRFWVGIGRTRSDRFLQVVSGSKTTTEVRLLDARGPDRGLWVLAPRREGLEYGVARRDRRRGRAAGAPQPHRARFDRRGPGGSHRARGVAAAGRPRPAGAAGGRRRLRRAPGRPPAQRGATSAAADARGRRRRRRLPGRVRPGDYTVGSAGNPDYGSPSSGSASPRSASRVGLRLRRRRPRAHLLRRRRSWASSTPGTTRSTGCGRPRPTASRCRSRWSAARRARHRPGPAAALRLRLLRGLLRPRLLDPPALDARPRGRHGHRPRAGGGELAAVVRRGKLLRKTNTFDDFVACARTSWRAAGRRPTGWSPRAPAPAGCWWGPSPTGPRRRSPGSSRRCRSSTT